MAGPNGAKGNIPLIRQSYKDSMALGERTRGDEFRFIFADNTNMEFLVIATQMPPLKRELVEIPGPQGIKIMQQGKYLHSGDINITFVEVLTGKTLEYLRKKVIDKEYFDAYMTLCGESNPGGSKPTSLPIYDCWLEIDAIDLSNEDSTMAVKPTGTIHCNWIGWDEDMPALGLND